MAKVTWHYTEILLNCLQLHCVELTVAHVIDTWPDFTSFFNWLFITMVGMDLDDRNVRWVANRSGRGLVRTL